MAQDVEMLLNNSPDGEVTVGAALGDVFEIDDTLPWEGSKPTVIVEVRRGTALLTSWQPLLTQI